MTESTLGSDALDENYLRFIEQAITRGCVWGLESNAGWALCPSASDETVDVMPLWSEPEEAQAHSADEWADYRVVPISLDELLDDWLPGMHQDVLMVGINWDEGLSGDEVEPLDLLEDFDHAVSEQ